MSIALNATSRHTYTKTGKPHPSRHTRRPPPTPSAPRLGDAHRGDHDGHDGAGHVHQRAARIRVGRREQCAAERPVRHRLWRLGQLPRAPRRGRPPRPGTPCFLLWASVGAESVCVARVAEGRGKESERSPRRHVISKRRLGLPSATTLASHRKPFLQNSCILAILCHAVPVDRSRVAHSWSQRSR